MGIFKRLAEMIKAALYDLFHKKEDPEKEIREYVLKLREDLVMVKQETAVVMAEETKAKQKYDAAMEEAAKYQMYAEKALVMGKEEDAKAFLLQKKRAEIKTQPLEIAYRGAAQNSEKMRNLYNKLVNDITTLESRQQTIESKLAIAKAQERVNEMASTLHSSTTDSGMSMSALDRMEEEANMRLDKAEARASLGNTGASAISDLERKYEYEEEGRGDVDEELEALKARLSRTAQ